MILIDTNVLIFAHNADSPHHKQAQQLMREAMESKFESCVSQQNLLEFFSIITNPRRVEEPFSSKEAFSLIENYLFFKYHRQDTPVFPNLGQNNLER